MWLRNSTEPLLIGVAHLLPTPGSPHFEAGGMDALIERVRADVRALVSGGCDALIVENFGDVPFHAESVPPETVAAMAVALRSVADLAQGLPVGVNVLRNDARSSLALCASTCASFLRVNVHSGAAVSDQGLIQGRAADTLRARARLAPEARILADVHVKHATPLGGGSIGDAAEDTVRRGMADGLIVTGRATGVPPAANDLAVVRERAGSVPVFVGSGWSESTARELAPHVDGVICGTALKRDGCVENEVDEARVARIRSLLNRS